MNGYGARANHPSLSPTVPDCSALKQSPDSGHYVTIMAPQEAPHPARPMIAGLCATLLGVGLSRFAYAPLLPSMIEAGWLSPSAGGLLGATNLAGYLVGALSAGRIARRFGLVATLRTAMLLAAASFALCAWRGNLAWFIPWRVISGLVGGVLMGLAGPAVQRAVPSHLKGLAAGVLFSGVGIGIMAGAVLVPAMLPAGLPAAWRALSGAALVLTLISWALWPDAVPDPIVGPSQAGLPAGSVKLIGLYALASAAATSHMVWWPDFIARGLGHGIASGAAFWFAYGAAAACGPAMFGWLADRTSAKRSLMLAMLIQVLALALPLIDTSTAGLMASSIFGGSTAAGSTALVLTLAKELAGDRSAQLWRTCTAAWGAAQAATGFFLAWLYLASGSHLPIFLTGLVAACLAAGLALSPPLRTRQPPAAVVRL